MARQGKVILFSDFHAGMSEEERRSRQKQMDEALETAADQDNVIMLVGDSIEGPFVPQIPCDTAPGILSWDPEVVPFIRSVMDRLGYFLEMIDRCDVLFLDRIGERLVFMVCAAQQENLSLIRDAIAGERRMLDELGIDHREVEVERNMIRIRVPVPSSDGGSAYC